MVKGHQLKLTTSPDRGQVVGTCSCGEYTTFGKTERIVRDRWNKKHVNRFDNWK